MGVYFSRYDSDNSTEYQIEMATYREGVKNFVPQLFSVDEIIEFADSLIPTINWVDSLIKNHDFERSANHRVLRQSNPIINL